jgi:hypothetical protein
MGKRVSDFRALALPAGVALVLTMLYLVATNGWTRLATPLPGLVAVIAGVVGFAAGIFVDRRRMARRARQPE